MGVPSPRTPVRVARGTKSVLETNKAALEEGEVCYATDENKLYVKEGSNIESISTAVGGAAGTDYNDSVAVRWGTGNDFSISHDGTNTTLVNGTGELRLDPKSAERGIVLTGDGSVDIYHDNAKKFETTATGVTVTGDIAAQNIVNAVFDYNDGVAIKLGVSDDLNIAHDGSGWGSRIWNTDTTTSDSWTGDGGTGGLKLYSDRIVLGTNTDAEPMATFYHEGACNFYYDDVKKFETTAGGVQIYGNVVFEGATADAHETTLAITDPTADRTITLPNATGTVALLQEDQTWTGAQRGAVVSLTDAATILVDFNAGNNFSVTLGANRTLGQPSNQAVGQSGSFFITQDGTGSRTLAYHADYKWGGGAAPTLSTAANAVDRIDYIVAAANKIHCVASLDVK